MVLNKVLPALTIVAVLVTTTFASPQPAPAKTKQQKQQKQKTQSTSKYRYRTYLVPPPPAYMPSILPELKGLRNGEPAKPHNPYRKYIYSRQGHEDPPPVQPNKYVTYWHSKS